MKAEWSQIGKEKGQKSVRNLNFWTFKIAFLWRVQKSGFLKSKTTQDKVNCVRLITRMNYEKKIAEQWTLGGTKEVKINQNWLDQNRQKPKAKNWTQTNWNEIDLQCAKHWKGIKKSRMLFLSLGCLK